MKEDRETTIMEQQERIEKAALNTFLMESALFGERDEDYLKYLQENEGTGKLKTWELEFLEVLKSEKSTQDKNNYEKRKD
jgi:hypothetical protein